MITRLHDPVVSDAGGERQLQIQVTYAPGTLAPGSVSYRTSPGALAVGDASVLPLVPPAVVLASRVGQDLRVDEPLPPAVHRGAREIAALLHRWYGWRPAELIAPLGPEPVRPRWAHRSRGIGILFTRGIDSWGTVLDRLDGPERRHPTHLVTVDNEVHLDPGVRDVHIAETQAVADRLGLPLIVVRTDIRSLLDPHTDWGTDTHGSVFAGIGMLLRRTLQEIVISPTHWTPMLRPWGSHPDLDPRWSIPGLTVTHHDTSEMRWQRTQRIMRDPLAARTVQVCWQGSARNCGRCEKCLRLMTSLDLLGQLDRTADRFDVPFDPDAIGPGLTVSPHPWCDTIDHLDHVGLAADGLRQRWERTTRVGRPVLWFQTRPIQPRIPVQLDADSDAVRHDVLDAVGRRLAAIGLRVDRLRTQDAGGPVLEIGPGSCGWEARFPDEDGQLRRTSLDALALDDLRPLLQARSLDPDAAEPFDPDGQEPPPTVPEPPGWPQPADPRSDLHR